jgi:hypothetical protein
MTTKRELLGLITVIGTLVFGMNYANTFFTFIENIKKADFGIQIPQIILTLIQSAFQPVYIFGISIHLILALIIAGYIGSRVIKR